MPEEVYTEEGSSNPLTKQLGPLQVWQWALVVVGGYVLLRIFRGGGSTSSSGTPTIIGGGSNGGGSNAPDLSGALDAAVSQLNDLSQTVQGQATQLQQDATQITDLNSALQQSQSTISNLLDLEKLQSQLAAALKQQIDVNYYTDKYRNDINSYKDLLAKCTTAACRTTYNNKIASSTKLLNASLAQGANLNTVIQNLQNQIGGLTSITVAPPNTSSANQVPANVAAPTTLVSAPVISPNTPISSTPLTV